MSDVAKNNIPELSRAAYIQAKVLDNLSTIAHEQSVLFDDLGQEEVSDAYAQASTKLSEAARELFPLYPHPAATSPAVQEWLRENGLN